jgi:hypothetical protein
MLANNYGSMLKKAGYEVREQVQYVTGNVGSGIHASAHHYNEHYMKTGLLPDEKIFQEGIEIGFAEFKRRTLMDMETKEVRFTLAFPDYDAIKKHMTEYARVYADIVLPSGKTELSEQHFDIPILAADDKFPAFHYKSTLDRYGDFTLRDLKTGKVKTPAMAQCGTYVWLLTQAGYEVKNVQLDYLIRPRDGEPPEHVIIKYDAAACMKLSQYATVALINDLKEFIQTGNLDHVLPNPRSENCSLFMCPLYSTSSCSGWQSKGMK